MSYTANPRPVVRTGANQATRTPATSLSKRRGTRNPRRCRCGTWFTWCRRHEMVLLGVVLKRHLVVDVRSDSGRLCRIPNPEGVRVLAQQGLRGPHEGGVDAVSIIEGLARYWQIEVPR